MKKTNLFLAFFLLVIPAVIAQSLTGKIENHQAGLPEMEIVLMTFGMDTPVKLGTVDAQGNLNITLPEKLDPDISKENMDMFMGTLPNSFFISCGNPDDFPEELREVAAVKGGYLSLWYNKQWAGTIYPVSNIELQPWMEDQYYMEPVQASFFEIIYVPEAAEMKTSCANMVSLQNEEVNMSYNFDLQLKKGFNLLEYQIEEIHKTNPSETASIPSKVSIRTTNQPDKIIWLVKYF